MSELDRAILAYQEDPSETNRAALMLAQAAHVQRFYEAQAVEFVQRVTRP